MSKRVLNILGVCGSGTVSSTLLAEKVKEILEEHKIRVKATGVMPQMVQEYVDRGGIDFVVTTSPIPGNIKVPVIKGVPLLTGFGEEECIQEILNVARKILGEDA
ncbi:MAG: PTS fructose transporter subunit IIB [Anaerolineae bacterium]|jgi:PTS system galactitol-specific IIB component|nr:MAG: PTS fructose transporter subunit IIB [Anaerolineae bacterium]